MGAIEDDEWSVAGYVAIGVRCGLSVQETLQQPVGLVMDLWEIYKEQHGIQQKNQID